ncbi:glycosyltransferase family 2 protein [Pelobacter seleniigenes]|uniref:glycosyltransferase family 2 protein n=1 Tax=Pelobacter seleniigenes TaxID=407188 RepID=UPI0004A6FCFC|nr:glycosyltransferase family 2 protein [Pelobacter seleniigenes]
MAGPVNGKTLDKYLRSRAISAPWTITGVSRRDFKALLVIPALAEQEQLPLTLASLARNAGVLLGQTLLLVVVNNHATAAATAKEDNQQLLCWLQSCCCPGLQLAWVDVASTGLELPAGEGVGLARKIGFDLGLEYLDWHNDPLLISLDADTLVDENYLSAVFAHFARSKAAGAVIPFRHQVAVTPERERAIRDYELYLRSYLFGLQVAGSPYAYHSIGSALCCRAAAYVAAGGMNRRLAAEDFYFLQRLAKIDRVDFVAGTVVRPAPRYSERVPFGTGRTLREQVEDGRRGYRFIGKEGFDLLRRWLALARENIDAPAQVICLQAEKLSAGLAGYLAEVDFVTVWAKLQRNHRPGQQRLRAFQGWFDALRTRQLLTRVDGTASAEPVEVVAELLAWGGCAAPETLAAQLRLLERLQGVD